MTTIMTFDALGTVTDTAIEVVIDAIKIAIARSSAEKAKSETPQGSVVKTKITRAEVLWFFGKTFPKNRANRVDQDKLITGVFQSLPENRIVHFKEGVYEINGETLKEQDKIIGVMLTAHDLNVKPIQHAEPVPKV